MQFWNGWALWVKLSVTLGFLLALVLVYSATVLTFNRRKVKKQAAKDAELRAEQEAEAAKLVTDDEDIPFGARALEKGIVVEGISTMKSNSTAEQPSQKEPKKPSSLSSLLRQVSPVKSTRSSTRQPSFCIDEPDSQRTSSSADGNAVPELESIHIDTYRASRPPKLEIGELGELGEYSHAQEPERPISQGWFSSRSSWITKSIHGYRRTSVVERRRQTSSEDFRRRFSKLFDETAAPAQPAQMFQLTPIFQVSAESISMRPLDRDAPRGAAE